MSFTIINGRKVETLDLNLNSDSDYPDFFEPKPVSPKKNIVFADNKGNIRFDIEELSDDHPIENNDSLLGKRKFTDAFGEGYCDLDRYGQPISDDFFNTNMGHSIFQKREEPIDTEEILDWCNKYLASKNLLHF